MDDGDDDFLEAGRLLFAGEARFIWGAAQIDGLPPPGPPEIAFAGRSNVGKSTLLNALTGRKALARASHTPGRTQELNFFDVGPEGAARLRLVDLPGYGYAAVGKEKVAAWTSLLKEFLRGRAPLARVYLLVDGRHGARDVDREMMDMLDRAAVSYQIVLTKMDEVKKGARAGAIAAMREAIARRPAAHPQVLSVSSQEGEGVPALRAAIARLLAERGG
ncbi:MAG: YihA family ribosome biogenesis GTP-binding protein [Methylobacteriaceae bacterium]|nr:YihA family ribosome biogenesis GTP-binding protein [Methylobacteriaceae bacterium]